jgi:hypothetical protein
MRRLLALPLITLALAACSQNSNVPGAQIDQQSPGFGTGPAYLNTQAAYDAQINAAIAPQSVTAAPSLPPQVYLNVLPIASSPDSVRAYVKSSYPSPITCSLTWGDGASSSVQSPTTNRIQTLDHAFNTYGSYTVNVTCVNGGTVVSSKSVTLMTGRRATGSPATMTFDTPDQSPGRIAFYQSYQENGYQIAGVGSQDVVQPARDYGNGFYPRASQPIAAYFANTVLTLSAVNGSLFDFRSFDFAPAFDRDTTASVTVTGYLPNGSTLTSVFNDPGSALLTATLDSSWTGLTRVTFSRGTNLYIIDNVRVAPSPTLIFIQ